MHTIQPLRSHHLTLLITPLKRRFKPSLIPPNRQLQPRKLPRPLHLPIIMLIRHMTMSAQLHLPVYHPYKPDAQPSTDGVQ
jgi:hypothetical protein